MSLLALETKQRIKRVARRVRLLEVANRVEYAYGNRITSRSLDFHRVFIPSGSLCFDIGAHYGGKTRLFRRLGAAVIAVEPLADCCKALLSRFGNDKHVTLIQAACGEAEGKAILYRSSLNPQNSTLSNEFARNLGSDVEWERDEQIAVTTLDRLIERYGLPAFCKIDTEGYEFDVLKGLSRAIPTLSFEFHSNNLSSAKECLQRLMALGYRVFNYIYEPAEKLLAERWLSKNELETELVSRSPDACGNIFARIKAE